MFSKRQIEIIELLLRNPDGIFGSKISDALGVSTRTIRNEISQINDLLKDCIHSSNKKGYFINPIHVENLKRFVQVNNPIQTYQDTDSRIYSILGKTLFNGAQNIYDLAEQLFVSEQTVIRDINKLKRVLLEKYHISNVNFSNNCFQILSTEDDIRYLLFRILKEKVLNNNTVYLKDIQTILNNHFDIKEYQLLKIKIKNYFYTNKLIVDDKSLELISEAIYIVIIRNRYDYKIEGKCTTLVNNTINSLIDELIQLGIEIEENDKQCLNTFIWSIKITHQEKDISNQDISSVTFSILNEFCREILEKYSLDLKESEETINDLKTHIEYMVRRIDTNYELTNPIISDIKKEFPFSYEVAMLIVHIIYKYKNRYLSDDEISYVALYIEFFLQSKNTRLKAVFINDTSTGINKILFNWIQRNFQNQIEIVVRLSAFSLDSYLQDHDIDLIISTDIITTEQEIPIFIIERIPENSDYHSLYHLVHDLKMKNKYKKLIKRMFTIDYLEIYDKPVNFDVLVTDMSKKMYEHGCIYNIEEYTTDVLHREENYPTIMGKHIVVPHPLATFAKKTTVSVALLKKPLIHNGEKIKLVFLLAIENKMDDDVSAVFHFIKQLATDNEALTSLIGAQSKEEFIDNLERLTKLFLGKSY
ncbi:PTS sugar transporter subunit IIA [Caldifermentibacillus hisashii]|uniref:BglG family transcription antiterminator n=1 Tax=Caldifermentibacillus hisashii TaxID=996558 RepID=UPI003D21ED02